MQRALTTAAALVLSLGLLTACEESTQDMLEKAKGAETKAQLIDALGDPDTVNKVGPIESWTYEASNGEVTFVITGDHVALQAAGSKSK